jgi:hypothetical protein
MGADLSEWAEILRTVRYGYAKPLYWIEMPDGKRNHMITRGKLMASLAVLRMNYPAMKMVAATSLPPPKKRGKLSLPK